jgi:predicted transcriptional regulator
MLPSSTPLLLQDFVARRCRTLGLSQTNLAARAGLTRAYLHRLL